MKILQASAWTRWLGRNPQEAAPVVLYHATYTEPPSDIAKGLHNVRPEIFFEQLICGSPILDFKELESVAKYVGFSDLDQVIKWFWEVCWKFDANYVLF